MSYDTYDIAPLRASRNFEAFDELFDRAKRRTVRIGLLCSSLSVNTSTFWDNLNAGFYWRYGNAPETPIRHHHVDSGYDDEGKWCSHGARNETAAGDIAASTIPPGMVVKKYNSSALGYTHELQYDCYNVLDRAIRVQDGSHAYLNRGGNLTTATVEGDLYAYTHPSSAEVFWSAEPSAAVQSFYSGVTTSFGTTAMGLNAVTGTLKSVTLTLPYDTAKGYQNFRVKGVHASNTSQILGTRMRSTVNRAGIAVTNLGVAGYEAAHLVASHSGCGPSLAVLGFDAYLWDFGVNDAYNGKTAVQFRASLAAGIAFIDAAYDTAGIRRALHIIRADSYDARHTTGQKTEFDQYVGAAHDLANSLDNVMSINSRRLTAAAGWDGDTETASQAGTYTLDGTHYTYRGAVLQAKYDVGLMLMSERVGSVDVVTGIAADALTSISSGVAAALGAVANLQIQAAASGVNLDLFGGDSYANADSRGILITEASTETQWPATLTTVYFWARPLAHLLAEVPTASYLPALSTLSSLTRSSTTATATTSAVHGLTTGDVVVIRGATDSTLWEGYYSVTVTSTTTFTYTLTTAPTATTASGTIYAQAGIGCTVTSATGSAQAFRFEPTSAQMRLPYSGKANGYTYQFVANAATAAAVIRSGAFNVRPWPGSP